MRDDICVATHRHDPERLRRALDGLRLCGGCVDRLTQGVAELPALHDQLLTRLTTPYRGEHPDDRQQLAIADKPIPLQPDVADHRDNMRRVAVSRAMLVAEERGLDGPADARLPTVAAWLTVHVTWASAQAWADEYVAEIGALTGRARSLIAGNRLRRIVVGACPKEVPCRWDVNQSEAQAAAIYGTSPCLGTLSATLAPQDSLLPSSVDCDEILEHRWTADQWMTLGRAVMRQRGMDAGGAARLSERMGA